MKSSVQKPQSGGNDRADITRTIELKAPGSSMALGAGPSAKRSNQPLSLFDREILRRALRDSFTKLSPRKVARNPVMFVVEIGSVLTTILLIRDLFAATRVAPL